MLLSIHTTQISSDPWFPPYELYSFPVTYNQLPLCLRFTYFSVDERKLKGFRDYFLYRYGKKSAEVHIYNSSIIFSLNSILSCYPYIAYINWEKTQFYFKNWTFKHLFRKTFLTLENFNGNRVLLRIWLFYSYIT